MVHWKFPPDAAIKAVSSAAAARVFEVAWQPGQGGLLALSTDRGGRIVNIGQEKIESVEFGTDMIKMFSPLAWSPAGDLLATIGEQNVIWNLNGIRVATLQAPPAFAIHVHASKPHFNDSGRLVLVTRIDTTLRRCFDVFDTLTGVLQQSFDSGLYIEFDLIVWKDELEFFSGGGGEETIEVWRVGQEEPIQIMDGHDVSTMAFNRKRGILATGGRDGTLRLWDPDMSVLTGHNNSDVLGVIWVSLDLGVLASYDIDGQVRIWDALSKTIKHVCEVFEWAQHNFKISFSPDGRYFAVAVHDENVRVVRVNTGETVAVCEENGKDVYWSPEGNKLAVRATKDAVVNFSNKIWEDVSVYNLEKIMGINLKDLSMMRVAVLLEKNLSNGKDEAKDVLTKEEIPEALITEICSHLM